MIGWMWAIPFGFPFLFFFFIAGGIYILTRLLRGRWRGGGFPADDQEWDIQEYHRYGYELEPEIFQLAYKRGGRLTVSDVIVSTGYGPKQAERIMEGLVDGSRVRMEVDNDGIVYYEFPEIIRRLEDEGKT